LETKSDPAAALVVEAAAETSGLGSWATVYEAVNSAQISKLRFMVSSVRAARRKASLRAPASAASGNLVIDRENSDGLEFTNTPRCVCQPVPCPVVAWARMFPDFSELTINPKVLQTDDG
jgi:hypothetical protein